MYGGNMKNVMAVCRFEIIHCLFLLLEFMCSSLSSLPAPHFFLFFSCTPFYTHMWNWVGLCGAPQRHGSLAVPHFLYVRFQPLWLFPEFQRADVNSCWSREEQPRNHLMKDERGERSSLRLWDRPPEKRLGECKTSLYPNLIRDPTFDPLL